jgi:predicted metal-binding membrane protein
MQVGVLSRRVGAIPVTGFALAGVLGVLSVIAWLFVAQANMPMAGTLDPTALALFTLIWGIGMVAMMFPSLVPLVYAVTVSARKSVENRQISQVVRRLVISARASIFILGYVAIWTLVGLAFYLAIAGLTLAGLPVGMGMFGFWAGLVLIATGLYQFSRFKQKALLECRSPMSFIFTRWRNGSRGAGVMGADYGLFCTRCCWVLMAGLLTVGAMSLPLMGVFSIIIFVEKIVPFGSTISKLIGAAFIGTGLLLLV